MALSIERLTEKDTKNKQPLVRRTPTTNELPARAGKAVALPDQNTANPMAGVGGAITSAYQTGLRHPAAASKPVNRPGVPLPQEVPGSGGSPGAALSFAVPMMQRYGAAKVEAANRPMPELPNKSVTGDPSMGLLGNGLSAMTRYATATAANPTAQTQMQAQQANANVQKAVTSGIDRDTQGVINRMNTVADAQNQGVTLEQKLRNDALARSGATEMVKQGNNLYGGTAQNRGPAADGPVMSPKDAQALMEWKDQAGTGYVPTRFTGAGGPENRTDSQKQALAAAQDETRAAMAKQEVQQDRINKMMMNRADEAKADREMKAQRQSLERSARLALRSGDTETAGKLAAQAGAMQNTQPTGMARVMQDEQAANQQTQAQQFELAKMAMQNQPKPVSPVDAARAAKYFAEIDKMAQEWPDAKRAALASLQNELQMAIGSTGKDREELITAAKGKLNQFFRANGVNVPTDLEGFLGDAVGSPNQGDAQSQAVQLPQDKSQWKVGQVYQTPKGLGRYKGNGDFEVVN